MTLPQRIEALMEAARNMDWTLHPSIRDQRVAEFIRQATQSPLIVTQLLAAIVMQAAALDNAKHIARIHNWPENGKIINEALNASADLVMMAKKLTTTKGE